LGNNLVLDVIYDAHNVRVEVESASAATPEPASNMLLLAGLLPVIVLISHLASLNRGIGPNRNKVSAGANSARYFVSFRTCP
jgi:hypothetical protein